MRYSTDPVVMLVRLVSERLEDGKPTTVRDAVAELGWSKGTTGELFRLARERGWLTEEGAVTAEGLDVTGRI